MEVTAKCTQAICEECRAWKQDLNSANIGVCTVSKKKVKTRYSDTCQAFDSILKQTEKFEQMLELDGELLWIPKQTMDAVDLCNHCSRLQCPISKSIVALCEAFHADAHIFKCQAMEPTS